jgi:hypothetical protein
MTITKEQQIDRDLASLAEYTVSTGKVADNILTICADNNLRRYVIETGKCDKSWRQWSPIKSRAVRAGAVQIKKNLHKTY